MIILLYLVIMDDTRLRYRYTGHNNVHICYYVTSVTVVTMVTRDH